MSIDATLTREEISWYTQCACWRCDNLTVCC